jgi:hypothetical protein
MEGYIMNIALIVAICSALTGIINSIINYVKLSPNEAEKFKKIFTPFSVVVFTIAIVLFAKWGIDKIPKKDEGDSGSRTTSNNTVTSESSLTSNEFSPVATGVLGNKRYEVYNICVNYETAQTFAKRCGGRLAMIKNQEEQDFIVSLFRDSTFQKPFQVVDGIVTFPTGYYLGGKKDTLTGKWLWDDGTDILSSYNNFRENEQLKDNYLIIYSASKRVESFSVDPGIWDDARPDTELRDWAFIVEYDV